ncbi:MAG: hypothetical protein P1U64_07085 [Alcanivoracaceae bacterium]|nr:hypothetical protein [Alcanivoracaceae bacterium]
MSAAQIWTSKCATADRLVALMDDLVLVANAGVHLLPLLQARVEQGLLPDIVPGARIQMVSMDEVTAVRHTLGSRDLDLFFSGGLGRQQLNIAFETSAACSCFYTQLRQRLPLLQETRHEPGPARAVLVPLAAACASVMAGVFFWWPAASADLLASEPLFHPLRTLTSLDTQLPGMLCAVAGAAALVTGVRRVRRPPVELRLRMPQPGSH